MDRADKADKVREVSPAYGSKAGSLTCQDLGLGVVQHAPLDVVLDDHNVLQPDIVFIGEARRRIVTQIGIFESPDLVVEILSPSTEKRDRVTKR